VTDSFRDPDEQILDTLRRSVNQPGAVPPEVIAAATGAFAWRTIDAELAALVDESWATNETLVGVRSAAPVERTVVFKSTETMLEIDITAGGLIGQIDPARPGTVFLEYPDGTTAHTEVDELGWFTVHPRPAGMLRIRCLPDGASPFVTEWMRLR
jgi:hypothetical protein